MGHTMKLEGGDVHTRTFWADGAWAGVIAGAVFMVMEMMLVWTVGGGSPWGPPRMIAAILMGEGVLPPPATFAFGIFMVAMLIHFALSILLGLLGAWIVHRLDMGAALLTGAAFGFAVYILNFYIVASVVFEWFATARNAISLVSHVVFGVVLTGAYIALRRRHAPHTAR